MLNLNAMFGSCESIFEFKIPDKEVSPIELQMMRMEIDTDLLRTETDVINASNTFAQLDQLYGMYDYVKQHGINRTFLSLYNRDNRLNDMLHTELPSCESIDGEGYSGSNMSKAFIAAMEDANEGIFAKIGNAIKWIWGKIKHFCSVVWGKIMSWLGLNDKQVSSRLDNAAKKLANIGSNIKGRANGFFSKDAMSTITAVAGTALTALMVYKRTINPVRAVASIFSSSNDNTDDTTKKLDDEAKEAQKKAEKDAKDAAKQREELTRIIEACKTQTAEYSALEGKSWLKRFGYLRALRQRYRVVLNGIVQELGNANYDRQWFNQSSPEAQRKVYLLESAATLRYRLNTTPEIGRGWFGVRTRNIPKLCNAELGFLREQARLLMTLNACLNDASVSMDEFVKYVDQATILNNNPELKQEFKDRYANRLAARGKPGEKTTVGRDDSWSRTVHDSFIESHGDQRTKIAPRQRKFIDSYA